MWIHSSPGCLVISDAIANANGTTNPMKPRYSMGGWITMVQYWSSGFRPWPSAISEYDARVPPTTP